jgi:spermidine/putrescine transport system ATP-binding protein
VTTAPIADRSTAVAARATELSKIYGQGETQVVALDRVSIDFRQAELTAIMGPSGSGKSTLMHCVAGLDTFSSGSVRIGETELGSLKDKQLTKLRRDKIGFIFQAFNLLPTLTALENITLPMDIAGRKPDKQWVDSVIQMVGLSGRLGHRPAQLSGGQQQRVAVARALINRPQVLLLDEPLGALDLKLRRQMQIELKRIQTEVGITFVHVTHDQEEAMTMADTIAVMNSGVIEQLGDPAELYERPHTTFVANFLGQSNLLPGTVTGGDGEHVVVDVHGRSMRVLRSRCSSQDGAVWFGVRPEKLRIVPEGAAPQAGNELSGTVTDASFTGVSTQYLVRLPRGQEITVVQQNDGSAPLRPGQDVTVQWAPEHGFALDADQDAHAGEEIEDEPVPAGAAS